MDPSEPPGRSSTQVLQLLYRTVESKDGVDPSEPPGRSGTQMLKLLYRTVKRCMQSVLVTSLLL